MRKLFPTQSKAYVQNNRSNVVPKGNIWSTFNMDFQTNLGVARVSPRLKVNLSTADNANFGLPVASAWFSGRTYIIAGSRIFTNSDYPSDVFEADTSTGAATDYDPDYSDLIVFNNDLISTSPSKLRYLTSAGGTWNDIDNLVFTTVQHKLLNFKKFNRLYWTSSGQFINSCDTNYTVADSGDYTITLDLLETNDIKASTNFIWIAGRIATAGNGRSSIGVVYQWDGISAQITNPYVLPGANGAFAMEIDPETDTPVVWGNNGILYKFNGSGFEEKDRLPFTENALPYAGTLNKNDKFIHPNGSYFTKDGTFRALINGKNNDSSGTQNENTPSGIWESSPENGFVHRYSFSYDPITDAITDFGQFQISRVGVLSDMNVPNTTSGRDGTLLAGATLFTNATATNSVIAYDNSLNTIQKKGYVVTDWFESDQIADAWDVFWMSYRRFLQVTDNIVPKYRNVEEAPVEATITWVNTTTFTVLNSAVDVSQYWNTETGGGEVEIVRGTGGGVCAHITNAVNNAGTWTVTIDEVATGVTTGTAIARFQKWKRIYPSPNSPLATPNNWSQFSIGSESEPRIEMKICFTFTGNGEYYKGVITSNEDIAATK